MLAIHSIQSCINTDL